MKKMDMAVAILIVLVVMIIIIQIPGSVLDFLLAISISLAVVILLNAVFANNALDMSVFP